MYCKGIWLGNANELAEGSKAESLYSELFNLFERVDYFHQAVLEFYSALVMQ